MTRLFVQSFDWRLARLLKQRAGQIKTGCLSYQQAGVFPQTPAPNLATDWTDGLNLADFAGSVPRLIAATGCDVWSANYLDLTAALIQEGHQTGLEVFAWTVNQPADMQNMIDYGIDAITTDYPRQLRKLVDACLSI